MKIIQLKSENIKNLKAIEISPTGDVVRLQGKNGAGKSAILDAIFTALTGSRLDDPIRHGEEKAEVIVDMGEFKVRKRWTAKGEYLEVIMANGDKKTSPQSFLNSIIGKLSFDPLSFQGMKPADQREILRKLVELDFSDLDAQRKEVYDKRTVLNAAIKGNVAMLQEIEAPHPDTPSEEILFTEELERINELRGRRKSYLDAITDKDDIEGEIREIGRGISERHAMIIKLSKEIDDLENQKAEYVTKHQALVVPPEVTENQIVFAEESLKDIENKNVAIRSAARYRKLIRDGEKLRQDADKLTQEVDRIEQDKSTRIANAKFPVDGLSISDEEVIFKGVPLSRISTGQQIRVSTSIAMKLNPTLRVIVIREGSLLDEAGKKEIFSIAKDNDYQVFMEEVCEEGMTGFRIEDGSIVAIDGVQVTAPASAYKEGEIGDPRD